MKMENIIIIILSCALIMQAHALIHCVKSLIMYQNHRNVCAIILVTYTHTVNSVFSANTQKLNIMPILEILLQNITHIIILNVMVMTYLVAEKKINMIQMFKYLKIQNKLHLIVVAKQIIYILFKVIENVSHAEKQWCVKMTILVVKRATKLFFLILQDVTVM